MITVKDLRKVYGNFFELHISDLEIKQGESFGLVGNNGAGKTTFFNLVLDLIPATGGEIQSKNEPVAGNEHWKKYTGSYMDTRFLIGFLTPKEYIDFTGSLYGLNGEDMKYALDKYEGFVDNQLLSGKRLIRDLSLGNKTRLGILAAIMVDPEVIVLDEPFAHLDPTSQSRLKNILNTLRTENGTTLLISSHDLKHITEVCERIAVLDNGEIKMDIKTNAATLAELEAYFAV